MTLNNNTLSEIKLSIIYYINNKKMRYILDIKILSTII